jgi:peroxiredoxin
VGQLLSSKSEINARHTKVVIISFGIPALVQKWIKETQSSFQFLIDLDKKAYQVYGLESSLLRSWSPKIWLAYARLMAQGRKWRGIQGDSGQLGGDFIVDQKGIIRMAYRSHDPADRPKIEEILHILDGIKT